VAKAARAAIDAVIRRCLVCIGQALTAHHSHPAGAPVVIVDTRKHSERAGDIAQVPAPGADLAAFVPRTLVMVHVDAARHSRFAV